MVKVKTSNRKLRIEVIKLNVPEKILIIEELDKRDYYIAYAIRNDFTLIKHGEDIIWKIMLRQVNLL